MSDESDDFSLDDWLSSFPDPEARARAWREAGCPGMDEHWYKGPMSWDQTLGPQSALAAGLSNHDFREYEQTFRLRGLREERQREQRNLKHNFMTRDQAEVLHEAISFCNFLKRKVLNTKLTLTWPQFGIDDPKEAFDVHGKLQNEMGMQLARWGHEHLYVYVNERTQDLGFHTHVMMQVERGCARPLRHWLKKYFANNCRLTQVTAFDLEPRYSSKKHKHLPWDEALIRRQWAGYRYLVKSLDPDVAIRNQHGHVVSLPKLLKLPRLIESEPLEGIKRCGVAHAIGQTEQRRWWFPRAFRGQEWDHLYSGWELPGGPEPAFANEMVRTLEAMQR